MLWLFMSQVHSPLILKLEKGNVKGEDLYVLFGNTNAGRHLTILFVKKVTLISLGYVN